MHGNNVYILYSNNKKNEKYEDRKRELTGRNFKDFFITANVVPRQSKRYGDGKICKEYWILNIRN